MAVELRFTSCKNSVEPQEKTAKWGSKGGSLFGNTFTASKTSINGAAYTDHQEAWFALRVKSRFEKVVASVAENKGFEYFLPLYESRRRWSDRVKSIDVPLFPGYVFCRLNPQHRLPLLTIPGALHFVGIGKTPMPIDDKEIASIQAAVQSGLYVEPWDFVEAGQRVRIENGPLTGVEGIYVGTSKQERIVVSVTLLKRSVAVAMERDWAVPVDPNGRPLVMPVKPLLDQKPSFSYSQL